MGYVSSSSELGSLSLFSCKICWNILTYHMGTRWRFMNGFWYEIFNEACFVVGGDLKPSLKNSTEISIHKTSSDDGQIT